jgi:hypothetical protein
METNKLLAVLMGLVVILGLVSIFGMVNIQKNSIREQAITDIVRSEIGKIPPVSTEEIATSVVSKIVIPTPEVPEFKENEKVNELWEELHAEEISKLKDEAYEHSLVELEEDDYELLTEFLEESIEDFDELTDVDVEDYEVKVVELGLEEDEDKIAEVVFEVKFWYELKSGPADEFKDKVIVTAKVVYDEGNFDDEDVELAFSL